MSSDNGGKHTRASFARTLFYKKKHSKEADELSDISVSDSSVDDPDYDCDETETAFSDVYARDSGAIGEASVVGEGSDGVGEAHTCFGLWNKKNSTSNLHTCKHLEVVSVQFLFSYEIMNNKKILLLLLINS